MKIISLIILALASCSVLASGHCNIREFKQIDNSWRYQVVVGQDIITKDYNDCLEAGGNLLGVIEIDTYSYIAAGKRPHRVTLKDVPFETRKVVITYRDKNGETIRTKLKNQ